MGNGSTLDVLSQYTHREPLRKHSHITLKGKHLKRAEEGPSSGFSRIMHRIVSSEAACREKVETGTHAPAPEVAQVGPSSGFSHVMHRLVSSEFACREKVETETHAPAA